MTTRWVKRNSSLHLLIDRRDNALVLINDHITVIRRVSHGVWYESHAPEQLSHVALRDHHVDADVAIDEFGYAQVCRHGRGLVCLYLTETFLFLK